MRLEIVLITAVSLTIGLAAAPVKARSSIYTAQVLENKQCQKCDPIGADVKDARQERQQQRQQRQEIRQERQEERQEVRQERQQQLQQQPNLQPNLQPEVRQERQEQRQQRQEIRQERQQQLQQQPNLQLNIPPEVRQERQEQRQQRQEIRQEHQEQRQDARREWIREQDAWWLREHNTWGLPGHETGWHEYGEYVYPTQSARSIQVHLISLTKDRVKVLIEGVNGKREIAFDGIQTRQTVYLSPGTHKLWFKGTADSPWISGTLNLGRTNLIRIVFDKGKRLVRVCDDRYAWIEDRYSPTESLQLNRTRLECPELANKD